MGPTLMADVPTRSSDLASPALVVTRRSDLAVRPPVAGLTSRARGATRRVPETRVNALFPVMRALRSAACGIRIAAQRNRTSSQTRGSMQNADLLQVIGIMILSATAVVLLARRLSIPTIVSYLLAGLIVGPILGVLAFSAPGEEVINGAEAAVHMIAEVGIALLLFLVGLELSLDKIRDVGKVAVLAGLGQVVFTAAGGYGICLLLGFNSMTSIFLATALTFSSTVVVVKLLDQKKELDSLYGRIAVGIFLVQDMVVIVALTLLAGLGDSSESVSWGQLAKAFGGMVLLLVLAIVASRYLLPRPFAWAARSAEMLFVWSLSWCFLFVELAHVLELSPEIGAFLAGMSLAQLHCAHDLRRRIHPLMNFFAAIFFIALGAQMDLSAAVSNVTPAIVLSLFVLIGNPLIFMVIISRGGYSERTSFLTSVTVAQISEFSFVFAAVGLNAGLINASTLSLIAVVGLTTIVLSSYMILFNHQLYAFVKRIGLLKVFRAGQGDDDPPEEPLRDHVIVVGMNSLGRRIVRQLVERGEVVLAIDTDPGKLAKLPCHTMQGNAEYASVLDEAGLSRARLLVSALQIEDANTLLAWQARRHEIPSAIHAFDHFVVEELESLGVDYLLNSKRCGARRLHEELERAGVMPA